jgi:hypothetical protein
VIRKLLLGLAIACLLLVGAFLALAIWFRITDARAEAAARELCAATPAGSDLAAVESRAIAAGGVYNTRNSDGLNVFLFPGSIFNAGVCELTADAGKVVATRSYMSMDGECYVAGEPCAETAEAQP